MEMFVNGLMFVRTFCNFGYSKSKKFIVELFFYRRYIICFYSCAFLVQSPRAYILCAFVNAIAYCHCCHLQPRFWTLQQSGKQNLFIVFCCCNFLFSSFSSALFQCVRLARQLQFMIGFYTELFHNYSKHDAIMKTHMHGEKSCKQR